METLNLTNQQSLAIAGLPADDRVIGVDRSAPVVRKPTGQLLRIQQDGRLTEATIESERRLTARRVDHAARHVVRATTPYTDVVGD
jgi:hypothetical protein